jgi:hypothetical protein
MFSFRRKNGKGSPAPLTDRGEIKKALETVSKGDSFSYERRYSDEKYECTVRTVSDFEVTVKLDTGEQRVLDMKYGFVSQPGETTNYGIVKLWPSESLQRVLAQMLD